MAVMYENNLCSYFIGLNGFYPPAPVKKKLGDSPLLLEDSLVLNPHER